ncbi:hypothetical protein PR202_ga25668 [Eleusine coracana subsp. coracana]|uniref:Uncharacterized protein n=1 Tax=Eleusine coracana subsp. coracana TaxID=191504 RepID=A0AAV5DBX4_ELECO|nr:hypothetical protein PR202_ga25668 [Eleusine coracana subsp. coracana]
MWRRRGSVVAWSPVAGSAVPSWSLATEIRRSRPPPPPALEPCRWDPLPEASALEPCRPLAAASYEAAVSHNNHQSTVEAKYEWDSDDDNVLDLEGMAVGTAAARSWDRVKDPNKALGFGREAVTVGDDAAAMACSGKACSSCRARSPAA